jgi:hypothetical protein
VLLLIVLKDYQDLLNGKEVIALSLYRYGTTKDEASVSQKIVASYI